MSPNDPPCLRQAQADRPASLGIAAAVTVLKFWACWRTGSVALSSGTPERIVNPMTATVALSAVHTASRPADRRHRFGHHKATGAGGSSPDSNNRPARNSRRFKSSGAAQVLEC